MHVTIVSPFVGLLVIYQQDPCILRIQDPESQTKDPPSLKKDLKSSGIDILNFVTPSTHAMVTSVVSIEFAKI